MSMRPWSIRSRCGFLATMQADDHYTIISADTHAGGSHAQYREYLDPAYLDDFDAWRNRYKNPFKDLRDTSDRVRNWDSERRWNDEEHDGVVGEVIFPNTVPPFFPSFVLFAAPPDARGLRAPARRHPRPQPLAGRLLRRVPGARAPASVRSSSTTSTTPSTTRSGVKEHGLRGGILLPNVPPDVQLGQAPLRPVLRPALEAVRGPRDRRVPVPRRHRQPRLRQSPPVASCSTSPRPASTRSGRSCTRSSAACSSASRS